MASEESLYPPRWIGIAEEDLARVRRLLENDAQASGFYLQQAVEKFLKAYLLSKGWKLQRIHDLEALLDEAIGFDANLNEYRSVCQTITEYYLEDRYPFENHVDLKTDEVRDSLDLVTGLIGRLREGTAGQ